MFSTGLERSNLNQPRSGSRSLLGSLDVYRLLAGAHLEGGADLIGGEIVDDQLNDLVHVVVDEVLALVGDGGREVAAEGLHNVPDLLLVVLVLEELVDVVHRVLAHGAVVLLQLLLHEHWRLVKVLRQLSL